MDFADILGIEMISKSQKRVEAVMPIRPSLYQRHGYLHGGVTISLLEAVASVGAEQHTDFSKERPFGIDVHVQHKKPGKEGMLHAVALLNHIEGNKQYWDVEARDDAGDIVSKGSIVTKIVTLERLAQKNCERIQAKTKA